MEKRPRLGTHVEDAGNHQLRHFHHLCTGQLRKLTDLSESPSSPPFFASGAREGGKSGKAGKPVSPKVEIKGTESNYVPPNATDERQSMIHNASYNVVHLEQSRLMVGHSANGEIREVLWTYSVK